MRGFLLFGSLLILSLPLACGDDSPTGSESNGGNPPSNSGRQSGGRAGGSRSNGAGSDSGGEGGAPLDSGGRVDSGGSKGGGDDGGGADGNRGGVQSTGGDEGVGGDEGIGGDKGVGGSQGNGGNPSAGGGVGGGGSGGTGGRNNDCTPPRPPVCVRKTVSCSSAADCGPTQICDGICRPAPAFGEPCSADWRCGDPPLGHRRSVCDSRSKICLPPSADNPGCVSDNQCPEAGICENGHCTSYIFFYPRDAELGEDCSFATCGQNLACAMPSALGSAQDSGGSGIATAPGDSAGGGVVVDSDALASPSCDATLTFTNPALEWTLRNAIQVWDRDIMASDVATLTSFKYLGDYKNGDLYGIECLTGLTSLSLEGIAIRDLSRISGLSELTSLSVNKTSVSDPSPLSGLSKLTRLSLSNNKIDDFTPLKELFAQAPLTYLDLGGSPISNQCAIQGDALHSMAARDVNLYVNGCCQFVSKNASAAAVAVATYYGACALLRSGDLECWGNNEYGHLGNGTTLPIAAPTLVAGISGATSMGLNRGLGCVVANGDVKCWGQDIASLTPISVGISNAKTVTLADKLTCALTQDKKVKCWGWNYAGGLGNGAAIGLYERSDTPVEVLGIATATSVSAISGSACASLEDGSVWCWGASAYFSDGTSTSVVSPSSVPVRVPGVDNARSVHLGYTGAFAVLRDGSVMGWAQTQFTGQGIVYGATKPAPICGLAHVAQVASGRSQTCARLDDGTLKCWGLYPLGDGAITGSAVPQLVPTITNAIDVSVGLESTCATLADGTAKCFGSDFTPYPSCIVGL